MTKRNSKGPRGPKIVAIPPGPKSKAALSRKEKFITKSIFLNSGSEAIENAVKVARAATKKAWLVSFKTAFHGRTLLDISLTGKEKPYREGFGPLVREVLLADYADPYRDPQGRAPADVAKARVEELERLVNQPEVAGCVAALEAVDEIEKALPGTKRLEARIRKRLVEIAEGHERIGEARGIGAMWALEFVKDPRTKEPDVDLARAVQTAGLKNGLILLTAGFYNNCIRLLPPINIPIPLMDTALDLLADSLDMAVAGKGR